ncbi:polyADP-ribose polymerase [Catovirus CTV1]|uniref:E2 ubiquitin-conjugating enzyme n=1 Tax=Catovirus CTV1 TaxID=1977631 RepID=A0A1V0SAU1_9VIRU|nr:polyADP-ribose polymerase [Catovirus CTV1]
MKDIINIINWPNNINVSVRDNRIILNNSELNIILNYEKENDAYIFSTDIKSNQLTEHLLRICKINDVYTCDELYDVFCTISQKINDIYKYCTICGKYDQNLMNEPTYCSDKCKNKFYGLCTNNIVIENFNNDRLIFELLLETVLYALESANKQQKFKPFPPTFENFNEIENILNHTTKKDILSHICNAGNDCELFQKIGAKVYTMLKFMIMSNNLKLKSQRVVDVDNKKDLKIGEDVICFEILHDIVKNESFNVQVPEFLYHGSDIANWYSIMRNGLKNYSGTAQMTHGAAYGNGIYFSDSAQMSNSYTHTNIKNSNFRIIGVAQVLDRKSFMKSTNIYVVPDENKVLLKYLIVIPVNKVNITNFSNFIIQREKEIRESTHDMINIVIKRLSREMMSVQNKYTIETIQLNNKIVWDVMFKKQNYNIIISIIFFSSYPHDPPIIMIKSPKISIEKNDCIFDNGVIMLKCLTPKNWNPKNKIINVLNQIESLINKFDIKVINNDEYDYLTTITTYDKLLKTNNLY